ncbi:MAG: YncE family protein [Acidobacteriaceae bacterium]
MRQSYPSNYREYAYVSNTGSNTVSVIDVLAFKKLKEIPVGAQPTGIAINPHKNEVYVVNAASNSVSVINAVRNQVIATIPVGKTPYFIDVTADGKRGLVANSGDNSISIIDLYAHTITATIRVGKAPGIVRAAEHAALAVVSERIGNSISVLDLNTLKLRTSSLPVCAQPTDLVVMPDGSKAFIACSGSNQIAVVALGSREVDDSVVQTSIKKFTAHNPNSKGVAEGIPDGWRWTVQDKLLTLLTVGKSPVQLALKPDTGELFATNFDAETVSEVLTGDNEVGGTYYIGSHPDAALVSDDNSLLYVANFGSNNVTAYSVDNGKVAATVAVGSRPDALALSANQNFLLVADSGSNDVAIVRTRVIKGTSPTLFTLIPVGAQPNAIAIKSFISK